MRPQHSQSQPAAFRVQRIQQRKQYAAINAAALSVQPALLPEAGIEVGRLVPQISFQSRRKARATWLVQSKSEFLLMRDGGARGKLIERSDHLLGRFGITEQLRHAQ